MAGTSVTITSVMIVVASSAEDEDDAAAGLLMRLSKNDCRSPEVCLDLKSEISEDVVRGAVDAGAVLFVTI